MDISSIKAVVFDCDGVLFDTALSNRKFYDAILDAFGKPPLSQEQFINVHMMTVKGAVEYLFPELDSHRPVYEKIKEIGYGTFTPYMQMEEGLRELLTALKDGGYIRGIATNRTNTMEDVLEEFHLSQEFDIVMTAAKVEKPKPDPEQLLKIMDEFKLEAEEILFIGDSLYDEQAARNAGTRFVAFKSPDLSADAHAESMFKVQSLLNLNE
ncbi:MAG: HAD family hydrolase [Desulfobacterales bacterium]|nr:HAD family hydrolase [Desulfobacterales bacterium]